MKFVSISFLLLSITLPLSASPVNTKESDLEKQFDEWAIEFEREYKSQEEREKRMKTWIENNELIQEHNTQSPKPSFTMGHNQFSDMTQDEYLQFNQLGKYGYDFEEYDEGIDDDFVSQIESRVLDVVSTEGRRLNQKKDLGSFFDPSVNWVEEGKVTPVKSQGRCGSCWDFSAVGVLESAHAIDTGELVALSEQEILDCDNKFSCRGGWPNKVFKDLLNRKGDLCTEESYPYKARKDSTECSVIGDDCTRVSHTEVILHGMLPKTKYGLLLGLNLMPVSVAVNASAKTFRFYKSGVANGDCGGRINHAVVAVGYSTEGNGYWLLKNSWGARWGDGGYIKLAMDETTPTKWGQCSVYRAIAMAVTN